MFSKRFKPKLRAPMGCGSVVVEASVESLINPSASLKEALKEEALREEAVKEEAPKEEALKEEVPTNAFASLKEELYGLIIGKEHDSSKEVLEALKNEISEEIQRSVRGTRDEMASLKQAIEKARAARSKARSEREELKGSIKKSLGEMTAQLHYKASRLQVLEESTKRTMDVKNDEQHTESSRACRSPLGPRLSSKNEKDGIDFLQAQIESKISESEGGNKRHFEKMQSSVETLKDSQMEANKIMQELADLRREFELLIHKETPAVLSPRQQYLDEVKKDFSNQFKMSEGKTWLELQSMRNTVAEIQVAKKMEQKRRDADGREIIMMKAQLESLKRGMSTNLRKEFETKLEDITQKHNEDIAALKAQIAALAAEKEDLKNSKKNKKKNKTGNVDQILTRYSHQQPNSEADEGDHSDHCQDKVLQMRLQRSELLIMKEDGDAVDVERIDMQDKSELSRLKQEIERREVEIKNSDTDHSTDIPDGGGKAHDAELSSTPTTHTVDSFQGSEADLENRSFSEDDVEHMARKKERRKGFLGRLLNMVSWRSAEENEYEFTEENEYEFTLSQSYSIPTPISSNKGGKEWAEEIKRDILARPERHEETHTVLSASSQLAVASEEEIPGVLHPPTTSTSSHKTPEKKKLDSVLAVASEEEIPGVLYPPTTSTSSHKTPGKKKRDDSTSSNEPSYPANATTNTPVVPVPYHLDKTRGSDFKTDRTAILTQSTSKMVAAESELAIETKDDDDVKAVLSQANKTNIGPQVEGSNNSKSPRKKLSLDTTPTTMTAKNKSVSTKKALFPSDSLEAQSPKKVHWEEVPTEYMLFSDEYSFFGNSKVVVNENGEVEAMMCGIC